MSNSVVRLGPETRTVVAVGVICALLAVGETAGVLSTASSALPAPLIIESGNRTVIVRASANQLEQRVMVGLSGIPHVDGAYTIGVDPNGVISIGVFVREHGIVDREALLALEDELSTDAAPVELVVRAHQGKDMARMAGPELIFSRS